MRAPLFFVALVGGAAFFFSRYVLADVRVDIDPLTGEADVVQEDLPPNPGDIDEIEPIEDTEPIVFGYDPMNLDAFLYMVRRCEHSAADVALNIDWGTFFGGARFYDFSDHPAVTGELQGVPLDFLGGDYIGKVSTAAGAFQITRTTWAGKRRSDGTYSGGVRDAGPWGPRLPDFSPESQSEAARRIMIQCDALAALETGDLQTAIERASRKWASLPGSTAGQGGRTMAFALSVFNEGLA